MQMEPGIESGSGLPNPQGQEKQRGLRKARFEEFYFLYWIGFTLRNCSRRFIRPSLARLGFLLSNQELDIDPEVT